MKVLVADSMDEAGRRGLERLGLSVSYQPELKADSLASAIAEVSADVLVVRSTRVVRTCMESAPSLRLIVRAGAGYDTIDVDAASERGIAVANCPGKNAIAVAELAWGLIIACDRRIPQQNALLHQRQWDKKGFSSSRGLFGRTLGILGLGPIGTEVAKRGVAFGMTVVAWSRSLTSERARELGVRAASTALDVASVSDVVSIHLPRTPETRHIVDGAFIEAMPPGSILINTSRGELVDEDALLRGVRERGIRAGLDVYQNEPASTGPFDCQLTTEDGVIGTFHLGASTMQAQQAIAAEAIRVIETFATTGDVENCVNSADRSTAACQLIVRHHNRPGVLSHVFQILSEAGINVEEMENTLYEGNKSARARIHLTQAPSGEALEAIRSGSPDIIGLDYTELRETKT